jgi:hypothetical protein
VTKLGALSLKNGSSSGWRKEITVVVNVFVLRAAGKCTYSLGVGRGDNRNLHKKITAI